MTVADNIAGRSAAQAIFAFIDEEAASFSTDEARLRYWQQLQHDVASRLPAPPMPKPDPSREPMTDLQAAEFGQQEMQFGKHGGELIDQIPLSYLIWLAESEDEFKVQLRRYVRSRRVQAEQDEPFEIESTG